MPRRRVNRISVTYRVRPDLVARVAELADRNDCSPGIIIEMLLDFAFDCVDHGEYEPPAKEDRRG